MDGCQPKGPRIPGGGPKRFHDSFNFVFYIVGECLSSAVDTSLARIRPLRFDENLQCAVCNTFAILKNELSHQDVSSMCCMYRGLGLPALVRVVDPEQVL